MGDSGGALREAAVSAEELGGQDQPLWRAAALVTLGSVETAVGRYDDALRHLGELRDLADRLDNARLTAAFRVQLGTLAVLRDQPEEARALLEQALRLSVAVGSTRDVTLCLAAFAQLAFQEGDPSGRRCWQGRPRTCADGRAARLAGRAVGRGRADHPGPQALGADRFGQLFAAGAQLNQRQAVAAVHDRPGASTTAP